MKTLILPRWHGTPPTVANADAAWCDECQTHSADRVELIVGSRTIEIFGCTRCGGRW